MRIGEVVASVVGVGFISLGSPGAGEAAPDAQPDTAKSSPAMTSKVPLRRTVP
jgi:hypothetical protein